MVLASSAFESYSSPGKLGYAFKNSDGYRLESKNLPAVKDSSFPDSVISFEMAACLACLPRAPLFADGSAFINHIKLVRKARNAPLPNTITTEPLIYQGESGRFLRPFEDIEQLDFNHGTDFEAEVAVITDFVPMGISPAQALTKIKFILIMNDVSLRGLIPAELEKGFGFFQSKPASALSPIAVTPDELGAFWEGGRLHLPMHVTWNNKIFGQANSGEMHFHFGDLIAHAARTRDLQPGTLIGSGTVANENPESGSSCIVEQRTKEQLEFGEIRTPYMKIGDTVEIEIKNPNGISIFGKISNRVIEAQIESNRF